jgi:hypothetical protein
VSLYASIDQLQSAMIRQLHSWWTARCGGDIPDRSDFDPIDFKRSLPNMLIADIEHQPFRVRYRVVGTKVVDATGFDITGQYLDQLMPTVPEAPWLELYQLTYRTRRPVIGTSTCTTTAGGLFTHEFGLFPLRKGRAAVDQVVSMEDYGNLTSTLTNLVQWRERKRPAAPAPADRC